MEELRWALLVLGAIVVLAVYLYSRRQDGGIRDDGGGIIGRSGRAEPVITGEDLWGPDEDDEVDGTKQPAHPPAAHRQAELRDAGSREPRPRSGATPRREPRLGGAPAAEETFEPELPSMAAARPGGQGHVDEQADDAVDWYEADPYDDSSARRDDDPTSELPQVEVKPAMTPSAGPPINPDKIVAMRMAARAGSLMAADAVVLLLRELGLRHGKFGIFHRHLPDAEGPPLFSVASMTEPGSFDLSKVRETQLPGVTLFMVLPGPVDPLQAFDEMVEVARALARELEGELLDESGSTWSVQRERYIREELIRYRLQHPQR
jgi:cell division protein ZipA